MYITLMRNYVGGHVENQYGCYLPFLKGNKCVCLFTSLNDNYAGTYRILYIYICKK